MIANSGDTYSTNNKNQFLQRKSNRRCKHGHLIVHISAATTKRLKICLFLAFFLPIVALLLLLVETITIVAAAADAIKPHQHILFCPMIFSLSCLSFHLLTLLLSMLAPKQEDDDDDDVDSVLKPTKSAAAAAVVVVTVVFLLA